MPILSPAVSMLRSQPTSTAAWGGLAGHCMGLPYLPILSGLGSISPSSISASLPPPGTLRFTLGDPSGVPCPLYAISVWRVPSTFCSWSSSRSQTSLVSSTWGMDVWACDGPSSQLGMLGTPYPEHVFEHQIGNCSSWQHTFTCLPFRGRIQSMMGSPHQAMATIRLTCCSHHIIFTLQC